jgi:uncharacterized protein (TIGR02246 family)
MIALMMVVLSACSAAPPQGFGQTDEAAIKQLISDFIATYNAKDALKLSQIFTGNGVVMPPNASMVRGTENVREYYVNRFAQGASDLELEPHTVAGSGTLAFASGDYRLNLAPPGGTSRRDRGKFLFILRGASGKWLLDHLMFSSDFAAPAPATD